MMQMRRGRDSCVVGTGEPPIYVNVDMRDGSIVNTWIDALQVLLQILCSASAFCVKFWKNNFNFCLHVECLL